jgi:hypothetical protein
MSKNLKIVGFVSAVMAIPIAISALLFNVIPDFSHLVLLFLIPLAIIHPLLGFNILESIGFVEPKAVVIEKKEESTVMTFTKPDLYIDQLPELTKRMLELTDLEEMKASENDETPFKILITQQKEDYKCQVHKLKSKDFFFRIVVDFEATPEEAFDFLSEITKRPQWDEICQDAGIIEQISHKTSIQVFMFD